MGDLKGFREDLEVVDEYCEKLSAQAFYIAGVCHTKTNFPTQKILKRLSFIQKKAEKHIITDANKGVIEFKLYQGRIQEADQLIKNLNQKRPDSPQKLSPVLEYHPQITQVATKALQLIDDLKQEEEKLKLEQRKQVEKQRIEQEKLAQELQEKFDKELEERKRKELLVPCSICKDSIPEDEIDPLETCGHFFHKSCLQEHIEKSLVEKVHPLRCFECLKEIEISDLNHKLTFEQLRTYQEYSLENLIQQNSNQFMKCPNKTCKYMFELEDQSNVFECPLCLKTYCLICNVEYHTGLTCAEFQDQLETEVLCGNCGSEIPVNGNQVIACICGIRYCGRCLELTEDCVC